MHGEPKVLWLKTFNRPCKDISLSLRVKFNAVLEETLTHYKHNFVGEMDDAFRGLNDAFTKSGHLTPAGKVAFWYHVDGMVKDFDRNNAKFVPKLIISKPQQVPDPDRNRYHMPSPPPEGHHRHHGPSHRGKYRYH